MTKAEVRAQIEAIGIVPAVRVSRAEDASFAGEAVYRAGIPIAEITMTVPKATDVISHLAAGYPDMVVGAGTVLDIDMARRCLAAGAKFLTSPGLVMEVLEFALKMDVFLEIVSAIDERQYFGVQFDPSNAIVAGDDPLELLAAVQDRVVSMHASDRYFKENVTPEQIEQARATMGYAPYLVHGVVGRGLNDYHRIFQMLSAGGFQGWVSIEDGLNGMAEMQASVRYLQTMRDRYFPEPVGGVAAEAV